MQPLGKFETRIVCEPKNLLFQLPRLVRVRSIFIASNPLNVRRAV